MKPDNATKIGSNFDAPLWIAACFSLLSAFFVLLFAGIQYEMFVLFVAFFVIALVLRYSMIVPVLFAILLVFPLLSRNFLSRELEFIELPYALVVASFMAWTYRFLDLWKKPNSQFPSTSKQDQIGAVSRIVRPFNGHWILLCVALVVALLVLAYFEIDRMAPVKIGLKPPAARAIAITWFLVFLGFGLMSICSIVLWRRLGKDQAAVYVRSSFAKDIDRELAPIERTRWKLFRKK